MKEKESWKVEMVEISKYSKTEQDHLKSREIEDLKYVF